MQKFDFCACASVFQQSQTKCQCPLCEIVKTHSGGINAFEMCVSSVTIDRMIEFICKKDAVNLVSVQLHVKNPCRVRICDNLVVDDSCVQL